MSLSIILFSFLIPGMIFSYTLYSSSYYTTQNQYLIYIYNFNMTWENTSFNVHVLSNFTTYIPPLSPHSNISSFNLNGVLTYYDLYYNQYYLPIISLFTNFTTSTFSINNGSANIPVIKFYSPGGSYIIVSSQYGFPILIYNKTYENHIKFNFSVKLNFVKPLPNFIKTYNVYKVNLDYLFKGNTLHKEVYVVSPHATFSYYNLNIRNLTVSALNISSQGYATVILPISEFPWVEPSGTIYVNGSAYSIIVQETSVYGNIFWETTYNYDNKSYPFMGVMIGHYYVLFFPDGGKISIIFSNFNQGEIVGIKEAVLSSSDSLSSEYVLIGGFTVVIVVALVVFIRSRRK
ncbi:hypothetical protein EWF20_07640 [Sulfolobus sp. S-194]|uniref:hypothetical protein n=1 Tax=Sulfolobus sp. S-194 TaxID=2512240 RepID=UPI001436FA5F|nr:hypothetical protein [Sulfolobus sp. S-194]QIW24032.1 hypothetical protein EWF20_07640 [Sulfolobus sp. S-194]